MWRWSNSHSCLGFSFINFALEFWMIGLYSAWETWDCHYHNDNVKWARSILPSMIHKGQLHQNNFKLKNSRDICTNEIVQVSEVLIIIFSSEWCFVPKLFTLICPSTTDKTSKSRLWRLNNFGFGPQVRCVSHFFLRKTYRVYPNNFKCYKIFSRNMPRPFIQMLLEWNGNLFNFYLNDCQMILKHTVIGTR